jgi:predicted methyltransferase
MVALNKLAYRSLKPGGIFIITDHAAAAGSGAANTSDLHRIDPALVRKEVEAAGFTFVGESKVIANPADTHTLKVFDPAIRGHTDQFALKFRKGK